MASKWSYKKIDMVPASDTGQAIIDLCNIEGVDGWELIHVVYFEAYVKKGMGIELVFKRKGIDIPPQEIV